MNGPVPLPHAEPFHDIRARGGSGRCSRPSAPPVRRRRTYVTALIGVVLTTAVILFPEDAFKSSVSGLRLWFDIVLPALLPFFVLAEIMMGLGVIHFIGVLLEPFMRPLFRIPGAGAFAVAIGLAAGYPLGAKVAGDLTRARLATGVEGERLVAFANTADPLFLVGAVAVGMFGLPRAGQHAGRQPLRGRYMRRSAHALSRPERRRLHRSAARGLGVGPRRSARCTRRASKMAVPWGRCSATR